MQKVRNEEEDCGTFVVYLFNEVLLPLSSVVQSYVFSHACDSQMSGPFTMANRLQTEAADHNYIVTCKYIIESSVVWPWGYRLMAPIGIS